MRIFITYCFIFFVFTAKSQDRNIVIKGLFLADTIHIGESVAYSLSVKHGAKIEIFFPEKSHNFSPFQLVEKIYFPTKTTNGISTDSAIYTFRTLNIEVLQKLALPITFNRKGTQNSIFSNIDSVTLYDELKEKVNTNKLIDKALLLQMNNKTSLATLALQIGVLVFFSLLWWMFFGNTIKKQFRNLSIYRRHSEFKSNFNRNSKTLSKQNLEKALILWKTYIGKLQNNSFITMTTTEIVENIPDPNLLDALKELDKSIYGNEISKNLKDSLSILKNIADRQYFLYKKGKL